MSSTRDFAVAILLDTSGDLLLQLRDNIPNILYPGKIGLFGGHREQGESFLECIVREVHEELSYYIPPECFERASHRTEPDPNVPGGNMHVEVFLARDIPMKKLTVTEGRLKVVAPIDVDGLSERLSPTALFALETFFGRKLQKSH
jgi:8-oxo-dGTP diphosphatase